LIREGSGAQEMLNPLAEARLYVERKDPDNRHGYHHVSPLR
jgi:hypothetical protein